MTSVGTSIFAFYSVIFTNPCWTSCVVLAMRIDLDIRKQVLVSPTVGLCGRAAKLDLHVALLQIENEILVGVSRRDVAIRVVRRVVQSHMPSIRMEDCDNLRGRAPARDVVF